MQAAIIADNAGTVGEVIHRIWPARSDSTSHMPRSLGHAGRYTFGAPPLILSHMSPCRGWMRNILGSMAGVLRFSYIARSLMCRQVKTTEGFIGAMFTKHYRRNVVNLVIQENLKFLRNTWR